MSDSQIPISLEDISALATEPAKRKTTKKSIDDTIRTYEVWFRLNLNFGDCSNPECCDPREHKHSGGVMSTEVNGKRMCRYCFVNGWNQVANVRT